MEKKTDDACTYEVNTQLAENAEIEDEQASLPDSYEEKRALLDKTKIVKQTWSILEIYQKVKERKLILDPAYQRNVIWQLDKKTSFIESLFMGIIIPPIYVVETPGDDILEGNTYEVVDGKQRLSTILEFINNAFKLQTKSLEYYADWFSEKCFSEVQADYKELTNAMLSSVLDIYVITANSPEFTKYDIFSRLNKGSEPLKVNEIRKAIYHSSTLKAITSYVTENEKTELYKSVFSPNDIKRYEDYGRFFKSIAFYLRTDINSKTVLGYNSRPREMINDVLYGLQKKELFLPEDIILRILNKTIQLMVKLEATKNSAYIIDACIYWAINAPEHLDSKLDEIVSDEQIKMTLDKSPSTTSNVNARLQRVYEILNG